MSWEGSIGWLAGILDGEGSIAFSRRGELNPQCFVAVKATDPFMIERVSSILSTLGVRYTYDTKAGTNVEKPNIRIKVSSSAGVEAVLSNCLSYLTTKRDEAEVMLNYLTWRKSLPKHTANAEHRTAIFTMQELTMLELQDLKRRRVNLAQLHIEPSTPLGLKKEG